MQRGRHGGRRPGAGRLRGRKYRGAPASGTQSVNEHYATPAGACGLIVSEEVEALDGLAEEDRRTLALRALIADAPSAWLRGAAPGSQRVMEPGSKAGPGRTG